MNEIQFQIEDITTQMATWLMEEQGMSRQEALRAIYNSKLYGKLLERENGLFAQSTPYIYDYLSNELASSISSQTNRIGQ